MGEINNINIPEWMTNEFFVEILEKEHNFLPNLTVINFQQSIATNKGDNYASVMYRVIVKYYFKPEKKLYEKTLIIKVIPSGEIHTKIMIKNNIYPREIATYREILSKVHDLLKSIGDSTRLSPRCIHTSEDPKMLLVFEDLKEQGYKLTDRKIGLNLPQTLLVLEKTAKLHACSAVAYAENPTIMNNFLEGCISNNPNRQDFLIFFKYNAQTLYQTVCQWGSEYTELAKKLKNLEHNIIQKGIDVFTRDDNAFNVFLHADLWTNNLMFKENENRELQDVLLLDYQLSSWGSPGLDLNFLFYGSVQSEVREQHFYYMIKEYHRTLVETLRKLNFNGKIPTIQDIHIEFIKTEMHGVNAAICLAPLAMMEDSDGADMEIFLQDSAVGQAFRHDVFSNPKYQIYIAKLLKKFDLMGYFD